MSSKSNIIETRSLADLPKTESDIVQSDQPTASESYHNPYLHISSQPGHSPGQDLQLPNTPLSPYENLHHAREARGFQSHSPRNSDQSISEEDGYDNRSTNQHTGGYDNRSANQHARNHDRHGHAETVTGSSESTTIASDEESVRSKPKHHSHPSSHRTSREGTAKSSKTNYADDSRLIHKYKHSGHSHAKQQYYVNVADIPSRGLEEGRSRVGKKFWLQICCACTVTWLCGLLFGFIALILAMMARYRSEEGDDVEANHIAWTSFMVSMAALILGLSILVTVLALYYWGPYYLAQCYCRDIYSSYDYRNCSTCY